MPIFANTFVWINEPEPGAKPETKTTDEPLADDFSNTTPKALPEDFANADFIPLSEDGSLRVRKSQYTEDMMGTEESEKTINTTTDNKKE
jgi:hypothetical protein